MNQIEFKYCKKHGLTEFVLRKDGSYRCKKCSVESVDKRRKQLRHEIVLYKGGKCEICGYDKCEAALEFHHLNPDEKEFQLSSGNTCSLEKMKKEADKCILVCANCHREIHDKINNDKYQFKIRQYLDVYDKQFDIEQIKKDINDKLTQKEIALKNNISISTLRCYLKKHNIVMKEKRVYDIKDMIVLMKKYKNYTKVGKELGISDNAVKKRFKKHGYPNKLKDLLEFLDR